ncbi:LOW QUALITY PROTEIN: hypothetical protein PHMEG_00014791 [Phytophthora megakarya]|uniref:Uncharacterized protein n=1 Tax=Phytophthora megakarya TaxID=4795 RepID=A0A225W3Z6_9STRA|nr:LOW QUALITY PROTEIN: hypothetical protein PHMEG_00014791 [Phytophthora megakarya]
MKNMKVFETGDRVWMYGPSKGPKATKYVHIRMVPMRIMSNPCYEYYLTSGGNLSMKAKSNAKVVSRRSDFSNNDGEYTCSHCSSRQATT